MVYNPFQNIKNYKEYNENEINDLIQQANKSKFLYDYLIDRLYFYNDNNKRNTKKEDYNILTARTIYNRENNEKELNLNYFPNYGT